MICWLRLISNYFKGSNISPSRQAGVILLLLRSMVHYSKPFIIVVWYRPPNSLYEAFSYLENHVGRLDSENVEFYVMGDVNCNMVLLSDTNYYLWSDITDPYGLQQLINEPVRVTDTTSTLRDLIYTNHDNKVVCSGVCHVRMSDYSLISAYRKLSIGVASKRHTTIKYLQKF